jgi:hypothetical protein
MGERRSHPRPFSKSASPSGVLACEVKGPSDQSRLEQMQRFTEVTAKTGKSIEMIQFLWRSNR